MKLLFPFALSGLFLVGVWVSAIEPVQTIVGEAANQDFKGMVAVGEVIQNRGSVQGFAGRHASHTRNERFWTWCRASLAWGASFFTDFTHGATLFENIGKFGFPESWDREKVVCVASVGSHYFFKEVA